VKAKNFALGLGVALALALPLAVPTVAHIETWKIVFGIVGLLLFLTSGMSKSST